MGGKELSKKRKPLEKVEVVLSESTEKLLEVVSACITENKPNNVVSKIGEVTEKDTGKVQGLFGKDTLDDFLKDYSSNYEKLEKKTNKKQKINL
jgi:broad-specificity NMP kinase